ncbi:hypothetical protein ACTMTJ_02640 [Phytohabitans sp. LJ34]|uniref:hypothetical protein n=1 Tax=Phytohabitans sp. LJ34 TaxID=3452217 RepID=UPI003F8BDC6B
MIALGACGSTPTTPDAPQQQNVLALLVSDAKGSLQKVVDSATKAESVKLRMDGEADGKAFSGQGVLRYGKDPKAEITMQIAGKSTTIRMIGPIFYIAIPEAERAEMQGKSWMKMDLTAAAGGSGSEFTKQFDEMDPVRQVKTLLAADTVTVVGEETIDGVKTVHYTVTNPVAAYLGQLDPAKKAAAEKEIAKAGVKDVKTDVWVDEKYQPRRMHVVMGTVSDTTVDYVEYGTSATVEAPPAAEVIDFDEMLEGLKTGG